MTRTARKVALESRLGRFFLFFLHFDYFSDITAQRSSDMPLAYFIRPNLPPELNHGDIGPHSIEGWPILAWRLQSSRHYRQELSRHLTNEQLTNVFIHKVVIKCKHFVTTLKTCIKISTFSDLFYCDHKMSILNFQFSKSFVNK